MSNGEGGSKKRLKRWEFVEQQDRYVGRGWKVGGLVDEGEGGESGEEEDKREEEGVHDGS